VQRAILCLALLLGACGPKTPSAPAAGLHVIRAMQLNDGAPSRISFESAYAKGTIEIGADVHIGYQSVTRTPEEAGASREVITLDGQVLDFWGSELKVGEKSHGKLAGEVQIRITREGVSVNGEAR
jgi:hypothetical protein